MERADKLVSFAIAAALARHTRPNAARWNACLLSQPAGCFLTFQMWDRVGSGTACASRVRVRTG